MTGRFEGEYGSIFGQWRGARERTNRGTRKLQRLGIKPNRPPVWNRADQAAHAFGKSEALGRSKDSVVRKMMQPAGVIVMQMCEDHYPYVGGPNPHCV